MKLQNNCKYLISSFLILAFCLLQCCSGQSTTVRPYKFGFTIDEQQHRSEQRDERGIVMGEFGFITADGIYHVTVYATDEQGRFRILAMKNYPYESPPKTVEVMVQPKIPPKTTTTTTPKPLPRHNFYTEACSGCSLTNGNNKPKEAGGTDGKTLKSDIRPLSKDLPNPSFSSAASPKNSNSSPSAGSAGKISGLDKKNVLFSFTADTNVTKATLIETLAFKDFNTLKNAVKSQQLFTRPSTLAPNKVATPPDIQTTHLAEESSEIVLNVNSNLQNHRNISNKSLLNIPPGSFQTLDQTLKHSITHHNKHQYQELEPSVTDKSQAKLTKNAVKSQQLFTRPLTLIRSKVGTPPDIQIRTTHLAEESSKIVLNVESNLKNHRNISNNQNKSVINIPSEAFKTLDQTLKHNTTHHNKHQYQELAPSLTNKIQNKLTQNVVKSEQLYTTPSTLAPSNVGTTPVIQIRTTHLGEGSSKIVLSGNSNLKDHRNISNNQNKSVLNIPPETLRTPGQTLQAKSPPLDKHQYQELALSVTNKSQAILTRNAVKSQQVFTKPSTLAPSKVGTTPAEESSKIVLSVDSNLKNDRNILNYQNVLNIPSDQTSNKNKQLHNAPPQDKHQHQVLALSITNNNGTSLYTDKTRTIINNVLNSLKIKPNNLFKHELPINSAEKEINLSKIPLTYSLERPNKQNSKPRTKAQGNNLTKTPLTNAPTQSDGTEAVPLPFNSKHPFKHSEIQTLKTTPNATTSNKQYTIQYNPVVSKGINPKTSQAAQGASASPSNSKTTAGNAPPIMDIIMQKVLPTLMGKKGKTASSSPTQSTAVNSKPKAVPSAGKPNSSKSGFDNTRKPGGSSGSTGVNGDSDLYRFKYILDYHGHSETGKRNGDKEGSYYVIGDDNVERTIEYVANEFGYQPRIRWRKLDSNEIKSKENTLKDYEFVWFNE